MHGFSRSRRFSGRFGGRLNNIRTILVPVDFSEGALAAVRHARELADVFHSDVHLLHVMATADAPGWALDYSVPGSGRFSDRNASMLSIS